MTFRIGECSSCGASYKLPASFTADRAKCKNCGGVVEIGQAGAPGPSKGAAPPIPAQKPAGAAAAASQPKKKREGPSMKERLLAQRQAEQAKQAAAAPKVTSRAASKTTPKGATKAAAPAAGKAGTSGSRRSRPAGSRSRSSRRAGDDEDQEDGGGRAGRRRHAPPKKKLPVLGFVVAVVLLIAVGGGSWWFLNKETATTDKSDEVNAAGSGAEVASTDGGTTPDGDGGAGDGTEEPGELTDDTTGSGDADISIADGNAMIGDEGETEAAPKPIKKEAPAGDPDSVDLTAIADFGPIAGCGASRFAELQELAATMVDPMAGAASTRAVKSLVESGKEAFPVVFNALKAQDLTTEDGFRNADLAQRTLMDICNGSNFGWKYPSQEPDTFHYFDKKVIVSWSKAWDQAKDNDGAWAKLAKLDKIDAPETPTKEVVDDATEDALDSLDGLDDL